jgi:hypothetical protein
MNPRKRKILKLRAKQKDTVAAPTPKASPVVEKEALVEAFTVEEIVEEVAPKVAPKAKSNKVSTTKKSNYASKKK